MGVEPAWKGINHGVKSCAMGDPGRKLDLALLKIADELQS
jgi:hypothetical protein